MIDKLKKKNIYLIILWQSTQSADKSTATLTDTHTTASFIPIGYPRLWCLSSIARLKYFVTGINNSISGCKVMRQKREEQCSCIMYNRLRILRNKTYNFASCYCRNYLIKCSVPLGEALYRFYMALVSFWCLILLSIAWHKQYIVNWY